MNVNATHNLHLRWATQRDLKTVATISAASFVNGWGEKEFSEFLRRRDCILFVAERSEVVVGYVGYQLHRTEIVLANFAAHPSARRKGVGAALLGKMRQKVIDHRRERMVTTVGESNLGAALFLRACGLTATGIVPLPGLPEEGYRFEFAPGQELWDGYGVRRPVNRVAGYLQGDGR